MAHNPDGGLAGAPEAARGPAPGETLPPAATRVDSPAAAPRKVRRWPIVVLRCVATLFFVLLLIQPVLAGMFISGDVDLLDLHEANSFVISITSWFQVLATVLVWRPGRGPLWPIGVAVLLSFAIVMQDGWGYARELQLHIPLGVLLVAASTALLYWSYGHRPGRGRRG
ncbi:hypothetical protein [Streptomyces sp. 891-h]|uniref:hypothetical protein n=1 Tax=Streptomyces sp. 891-h TaxID=2720714 RepID=UPI001FAA8DB5|nr:hypothetical protein [Streptomyces sp. 891-h]UNZ19951.1 hypothetical protein HC362_25805 [Streptomyces sp. 891-h]